MIFLIGPYFWMGRQNDMRQVDEVGQNLSAPPLFPPLKLIIHACHPIGPYVYRQTDISSDRHEWFKRSGWRSKKSKS